MARNRFIKVKSDFTIKKKIQTISGSVISERDYVTTTGPDLNGATDEERYVLPNNSNFVFVSRAAATTQKKHTRGHHVLVNNQKYWTATNFQDSIKTTENTIKFNPDYNSISDFACYGSAVDLVKASVNNIIMTYPGELYFMSGKTITLEGKEYYIVDNPFGIIIDQTTIDTTLPISELRYFAKNFDKYGVMAEGQILGKYITSVSIESIPVTCDMDKNGAFVSKVTFPLGEIINLGIHQEAYNSYSSCTLYVYLKNGVKTILYDNPEYQKLRIRPITEEIDKFFENLDDFEAVLLNRKSNPMYKAILETPFETDKGYYTSKRSYVWPTKDGWNLDISSSAYENYLDGLLNIAEISDERTSNNIWRMMTHKAIKNLDWTFLKYDGNGVSDETQIDYSRIEVFLKLYGRQFDDIKRYIDNIKLTKNVSYDNKNNVPDYFLSDKVSEKGWDIKSISPSTDNDIITNPLYKGENEGYTCADANLAFLKRLYLNSKYLTSIKGTKNGIETMLGLLGFSSDEYSISEYINVASETDLSKAGYISKTGKSRDGIRYPLYDDMISLNMERDNYDEYPEIPIKKVSVIKDDETTIDYAAPWFEKGVSYPKDLYFQMYGGWGKTDTREVNLDIAPEVKYIKEESTDDFRIYDESTSKLRFISDLDELTSLNYSEIFSGMVAYVTDTKDIETRYKFKTGETKETSGFSHYFILKNIDASTTLGYYDDTLGYGWKAINESDVELATGDGKKVVYLETITETIEGNNPHNGNNKYDLGQAYIDAMSKPVAYGGTFSQIGSSEEQLLTMYGYKMEKQEDNQKCWYFTDLYNRNDKLVKIQQNSSGIYEKIGDNPITLINSAHTNGIRTTKISPFNPETSAATGNYECDEAAANSIVNTKNILLTFTLTEVDEDNTKESYIRSKILPIIAQMIPSTTIFEYKINGPKASRYIKD